LINRFAVFIAAASRASLRVAAEHPDRNNMANRSKGKPIAGSNELADSRQSLVLSIVNTLCFNGATLPR
ncbi:MAG: hypothetical protein KDC47_10590, partial [Flavobacteriaceae bacterium]|nr:hypothetical protein [Flavobacteriaceae bacterium]